ncbi:Nucleolar transcription factor 1 [Plecturocebus cupreus]
MFICLQEKQRQLPEERPGFLESELACMLVAGGVTGLRKSSKRPESKPGLRKCQELSQPPEPPKRAQEIWQRSIINNYLACFKNDE